MSAKLVDLNNVQDVYGLAFTSAFAGLRRWVLLLRRHRAPSLGMGLNLESSTLTVEIES